MRAYLAVPDREAELLEELARSGSRILDQWGRLILADSGPSRAAWASNVWLTPERIAFESIADAARQLQSRQRNWAFFGLDHFRRGQLIAESLPHVSAAPLRFGDRLPKAPLGSFTLLEPNLLLASAKCSSPFSNGEVEFEENAIDPPSRAYLKLWEVFTLAGKQPKPGETCIDLGACPGGWTWVLAKLGASVISVDKSPLAPNVAKLPNVKFRQGSAFALDPATFPKLDWLFSDVICYPERLLEHVQRWIALDKATNFVCTLKFQGDTDHETTRQFAKIPGSRVVHLHHNKHELTWFRIR